MDIPITTDAPRPEPCCNVFAMHSIPRDELIKGYVRDGILSEEESAEFLEGEATSPSIEWRAPLGAYSLAHTVIRHCPWCGTVLPNESHAAIAEGRKRGAWFEHAADGELKAWFDGQPVDPEALMREFRDSANDQDQG